MEHEFIDHDLTLQKIMGCDSEMEYITKERNLIPSMIEQICTELTEDKSDGAAYRSNVLVRKRSVDYFESLGYNLFRQFESEMSCEYFDRPISTKSGENMNGTVKFAIVTTLEYALDIFTYGIPSTLPSLWDSFGYFVVHSEDAFPPGSRNRIDYPTTFTLSRSLFNRSALPVWGSTQRLPTSYAPERLGYNLSLEEYPLDSEEPNNEEYFFRVTTLRSSLRDRYVDITDSEDLNITESEDSNSGTTAILSSQNDTDSCGSSVTMKHVNEHSVTKMENNSFETSRKQINFNLSNLEVNDISSDENNVENEFLAAREGHMEHKYFAKSNLSPNLGEDNSSSSDSLEVATAAKEFWKPGNSSFQSTGTYCNNSNSDSYVQKTKCQEPRLPLTNNYSEASKADEVQKENLYLSKGINDQKTSFSPSLVSDDNSFSSDLEESMLSLNCSNNYSKADKVKKENFYLPKKINDLEKHLDRNRENCVRRKFSLDASLEDSSLSVQEQEDKKLSIQENSFFPKHIALKRSASSPASSPRSSFRSLRNPKKGKLSQPDLTDSRVNGISNFPGTSTTNKNNSFSDTNVFYLQTQEPSRENLASVTEVDSLNQQEETRQTFQLQEEQPESFQLEEGSRSEQIKSDDFDSEQNQRNSELQENEHSAIFSEGFIQSIEIKMDEQVKKKSKLPPVDLSLVWNRKYFDSKHHVAFKLDHPFHYKREYNRIRKSRFSVFNSLMSRQTNGPLSQRKVLEVIARPHYNIYPPADEKDIRKCELFRYSNEFMNVQGYLILSLESCRTFDSYPMSSK